MPWVLAGESTYGCSRVGDALECVWPGELRLELDEAGGRFELEVVADRGVNVPLPGDRSHFPRDVRVDGRQAPVLEASNPGSSPYVRLEAGEHRVEGRFAWDRLPELLPVPPSVARVALVVGGERVKAPRRNDEGQLWLRSRPQVEGVQGRIEVEVSRKLEDGVPFRITTRLAVRAAGDPREVTLGRAVLGRGTPVEVQSDLAVRVDPEGTIVVQVHAGEHTVSVVSLMEAPPEALSPPSQPLPWPETEVWAWVADEALRQVEIGGAPTVDPARTSLPGAWRAHPAYLLTAEGSMRFETTRRGEPRPAPSELSLAREMWLDLDGRGYTVRDRIQGSLHEGFRLDLVEGELGHVVLDGTDQLVTRHAERDGVEVRRAAVDLRAEWRLEKGSRDLPAVGWSEDVQSLMTELHLPPGWSLLAVEGVDEAAGSWIGRWNLWGIFFVLLLSLAVGRLLGPVWGLVAFATLGLAYHEAGSPLWSWAAVVALLALRQVLPENRFARAVRLLFWTSAVVLLLVAVPFAARQLQGALFPHTVRPGSGSATLADPFTLSGSSRSAPAGAMAEPEAAPLAEPPGEIEAIESDGADVAADEAGSSYRKKGADLGDALLGSRGSGAPKRPSWLSRGWVDPNVVIQTGPGVPDWSWESWELRWSGPVVRDHELRLWLIGPGMNRALALLRALLLGILLLGLLRAGRGRPVPPRTWFRTSGGRRGKAGAAIVGAALLTAGTLHAAPVAAQPGAVPDPSDARLAELRERLTRPPACAPRCVLASAMSVQVTGERARIEATVHAGARAAYRVPGPAESWVPDRVTVDGRESAALALLGDGFLFLRLEPGVHRVVLEGPIPARDSLTLAFGEPPRALEVQAEGWEVQGLRPDGQSSSSIQFRRILDSSAGAVAERELPAWLVVHRRLEVGVRWTMTSRVERVTPPGSPVVVRVPLLEGESVTQSDVLVDDGEVVVSLGRDDRELVWTSVLEPREALALEAPEGVRRSERWTLACSPIWRCSAEGIAPVERVVEGRWEPRFVPWPGERLSLAFARPEAAEGRSTTLDRAALELSPGVRMLRGDLTLVVRTSSGGSQAITLPSDAKVQSLDVGGESRPVQREGDVLRVTLEPGPQTVRVGWQQPRGLTAWFTAPAVAVGGEAVNARVTIRLPTDRWLLWTAGPDWGAAVLFWPYLLLVLVLALFLGRSRTNPLGIADWGLLGLGLTQLPAWAALLVVGWFVAMERRRAQPDLPALRFNFRQLGLAFYSLVALGCLYAAVHVGLLMQPDMQVEGTAGGGHALTWYTDRIEGKLPEPRVLSLPMWVWRIAMLAWALWLAFRLVGWARWGWRALGEGGLWKRSPGRAPVPAAAAAGDADGGGAAPDSAPESAPPDESRS